jgi:hypothetical protein
MKKVTLLTIFFLSFISFLQAQMPLIARQEQESEPKEKFTDRLYFGGSFGLQFGTQTFIEIAPIIGYRLTERLYGGLGLKYQYYKYNDNYFTYSSNIYGGGPFAQFIVFEGLFLHAEYEILNLEVPDLYYQKYTRENVSSVFLGGGYRQMMGSRSALDFLVLYNVNYSTKSPYSDPWVIRIGFGFGL